MTPLAEACARAVTALDALNSDPESDHGDADKILLSVVPAEVATAYERARVRSGGWWYA